ncbi:MAG: DUF3416 domain-containing protein, partial [Leptospiraceae bacterium]|nr:DUF3416 domain-containing protein [Leptospiraceae bacterium]
MINARIRPLVETITPCIDDGRYAIKRVRNEDIRVRAVIISDGHDRLNARILFRALSTAEERALPADWSAYRSPQTAVWYNAPLEPDVNDEWVGHFRIKSEGLFVYTVEAWVDHFRTWRADIRKKFAAGQDVQVDMQAGIQMIQAARDRARTAGHEHNAATLDGYARELEIALRPSLSQADVDFATGLEIYTIMEEYSDRSLAARFDREQFVR